MVGYIYMLLLLLLSSVVFGRWTDHKNLNKVRVAQLATGENYDVSVTTDEATNNF